MRACIHQHLTPSRARPANVVQARAPLRKGLDDSLANKATQRAERETMRAACQQREHGAPAKSEPAM